MSLKISANQSTDFEIHPAGVVAARCTRIIDLGTQPQRNAKSGEMEPKKKLVIQWESEQKMSGGKYDGQPYLISQRYTASLHEKASLRKDLEAWRGRKMSQAEIERSFDLKNVLGKACMLNITHSDDGKYANISSIMPLPGSMTAPEAFGDLIYLSLDPEDFDADLYDKLSDGLKKTIAASPEYQQLTAPKPVARKSAPAAQAQRQDELQDDDIPF